MKEIVRRASKSEDFLISSRGISDEEFGNDIYPLAKQKLTEKKIPVQSRKAKLLTQQDIDYYDYIVVMEQKQKNFILKNWEVFDSQKIQCLSEKDIADPWYSGDFETAYQEIYRGCEELLRKIFP